jgi:hypothetical protein
MPDYAGIIAAQAAQRQTAEQAAIAREQLAWAKQTYADNQKQIQPVLDRTVRGMDQQYDFTKQQQDFYTGNYQPLEQDFIETARNYDTPEYQDYRAGRAAAGVAQQFEGARLAAEQQLKDFGVDPSSPKYASTALGSRLSQAAATAGAANQERNAVTNEALALKQSAINVGRGYAGNVNAGYGGAAAVGQGAVGGVNTSAMTGSQMMGNPTQWAGLSNQSMGTWGNIANNNYSNYMQGYQIQNTPQSSGVGSALGLIGGSLAGNPAFIKALADGGPVSPEASPSMGANTDDIPARLNAGEFIMPREAVSWFGEKAMHDMIIKAQKERSQIEQQSGAVPDLMPARPEAPRLISGPKPVAALPAR